MTSFDVEGPQGRRAMKEDAFTLTVRSDGRYVMLTVVRRVGGRFVMLTVVRRDGA